MSFYVNQGPSFNNKLSATRKLNGFFQRFELNQDDPRFTPGKRQPKLRAETMKGTHKMKKGKPRTTKNKQIKYTDAMPKDQPAPIYSGFGNIKNKATSKAKKSGGKLKRQNKKVAMI